MISEEKFSVIFNKILRVLGDDKLTINEGAVVLGIMLSNILSQSINSEEEVKEFVERIYIEYINIKEGIN